MSKLQTNNIGSSNKAALKAINLRPPFVKVEDASLNYRPIYYEMHSAPMILRDRFIKTSPFYYPHRTDAAGHAAASAKHADVPPVVPNYVGFLHSSGYCELCDKEFRHINAHIKTKTHTSYATNGSTYTDIDDVIRTGFMNEKFSYVEKPTIDVTVIPDLLKTKLPLCDVKFELSERIDTRTNQMHTIGMFHHKAINQGVMIYCTKARDIPIEPLCVDYLNRITNDSAVHPQVLSLSNIEVAIDSYGMKIPVCIIESSCMFITKTKKLPFDCTSNVKLDLFLFSPPKLDTHVVFTLLTHPRGLFRSIEQNSKSKMEDPSSPMDIPLSPSTPWNIKDIIKAIQDMYPSHNAVF